MSSADTTTEETTETEAPEVDERRQAILDELTARLGDAVVGSHIRPGDDLWVRVGRDAWRAAGEAVLGMGYEFFDFLSAIDWMPSPFGRDMDAQEDLAGAGAEPQEPAPIEQGYAGGDTRFQVIAHVWSVQAHLGIHLKCDLPDDDLTLDSWVPVYRGANWHERETWEMFGITFTGHPNLTHIYLPAEFQGNPLRKDFPLLARRIKPWPGIVDVEPMPGSDDSEGDGE